MNHPLLVCIPLVMVCVLVTVSTLWSGIPQKLPKLLLLRVNLLQSAIIQAQVGVYPTFCTPLSLLSCITFLALIDSIRWSMRWRPA